MDVYGFVYIWMDRKHKRFYIGSHWGYAEDGYVCSSKWMKNAYKRRPQDFKRRILKTAIERSELIAEEQKWLNLIPIKSIKTKYYNLNTRAIKHWHTSNIGAPTVKQKISASMKARHQDPEYQASFIAGRMKLPPQSQETREKRRQSMMGKNAGKDTSKAVAASILAKTGRSLPKSHVDKIKAAGHFKGLNTMRRTCSCCGLEANPGTIGRYHNNNCKKRNT